MITRTTLKPISTSAFRRSLLATWGPRDSPHGQTIGLAISGGVDSMALASLSKMLHDEDPKAFQFKCFVVDHRARKESQIEAKQVEQSLRNLGLPVETLTLQWPDSDPPLSRRDFETEARKLRYQCLGRACLQSHVSNLFLAHHEDDQAETLFVRTLGGYMGRGLRAMRQVAAFPESHGIYGVHEGFTEPLLEQPKAAETGGEGIPVASLGMRIHRPLLEFPKKSLVATCKHHGIIWFEDSTNSDKAATPRNTVRSLLAGKDLPEALRKNSLLALNRRATQLEEQHSWQADELLKACEAGLSLDPRTGRLSLMLPNDLHLMSTGGRTSEDVSPGFRVLIHRLTELVTPQPSLSSDQVLRICKSIVNRNARGGPNEGVPFTGAGTYWQPQSWPTSSNSSEWSVTRQPFGRGEMLQTFRTWTTSRQASSLSDADWQLFDGRFWIRASSQIGTRTMLRPLTAGYLTLLKSRISSKQTASLEKKLAVCAPGAIRWTLPFLLTEDSSAMALPSLHVHYSPAHCGFEYSVRYKHLAMRFQNLGAG